MIQSRVIVLTIYQKDITNRFQKKTELSKKENDSVMKKLNVSYIKSKCRCPSLLIETNLFVKTKAHPLTSLGTTPLNLNSTLIG